MKFLSDSCPVISDTDLVLMSGNHIKIGYLCGKEYIFRQSKSFRPIFPLTKQQVPCISWTVAFCGNNFASAVLYPNTKNSVGQSS